MKKLLMLTTVGAMLAAPANAVQKCVALNTESTECAPLNPSLYLYTPWWEAKCTTNDKNLLIKGIGACSRVQGNAYASAYPNDTIPTVSDSSDTTNVNCWCKMISPAVSRWVFAKTHTSVGDCAASCAFYCVTQFRFSEFLSALFGSLTN